MCIKRISSKPAPRKIGRGISVIVTVLFLIPLVACPSKQEEEIPVANVVGIRTSITRILISPVAFDAAIVAVEGMAHDVKEIPGEGGKQVTIFKLSDLQGNFINVSALGKLEIMEDDSIVVGGVYRRQKNEIEAEQIEKIVKSEK